MEKDWKKIHEKLSVQGLMSALYERARLETKRPKMARSTIYYAFEDGPTTPLRGRILEIAEELLNEQTPAFVVA